MNRYDNYNPEISDTDVLTELPVYTNPPAQQPQEHESVQRKQQQKRTRKEQKPSRRQRAAAEKSDEPDKSLAEVIRDFFHNTTLRYLTGIFLFCFGTYLTVSFISYLKNCFVDQSEIHHTAVGMAGAIANAGGEGGARIADLLIDSSFGLGSVVIIFWLFAMGLKMFGTGIKFKSVNFTIKCLIALIAVSLMIGLATIGLESPVNWGGMHGRYVNEFVIHFLGWIGAAILCIFVLAVFVSLCLRDFIKWIIRVKKRNDARRAAARAEREAREARDRELRELAEKELAEAKRAAGVEEAADEQNQEPTLTVDFSGTAPAEQPAEYTLPDIDDEEEESPLSLKKDSDEEAPANAETEAVPAPVSATDETTDEKKPMVVNVNEIAESKEKRPTHEAEAPKAQAYKFPPYALLREGQNKVSLDKSEQLANEERIRATLAEFGISITSIEATIGPTVTLYEVVPDSGVKISRISSLADDIALRLAAKGVRIIPQVPGKGTVGIEVPNKDPQTVSMRTILKSRAYQENKCQLPVAFGSTISNEVFITDLAKMPHLLVAGATGQGKSVGLNVLIASLLYAKRPDELKFVMIDPKMVEFSLYSKIEKKYLAKMPGETDPIITDMSKAVATLSSLCVEMDDRYQLLRKAHARNIVEYNDKIAKSQLSPYDGHRFLPYIVLIVDEYADLMMTEGKEVETPIARLAQKARAVGIHVIIATQRPSTNVITGIIKGNFIARIAFKVGSGVDSKTILDHTGAQSLIGKGDMLISLNSETTRVQCAFIDTPEVEALCDYIEQQPYEGETYILPEPVLNTEGEGGGKIAGASAGDRDPLFDEIARKIAMSSSASTSYLQRTYGLGFARAGRIMDQLEAAGVVGPSYNGKPRQVLMDQQEVELMLHP